MFSDFLHYLCRKISRDLPPSAAPPAEFRLHGEDYMIEIIEKYFPNLTEEQKKQFEALDALYRDWNSKINVISRKDIDNLYEHAVEMSFALPTRRRNAEAMRRFGLSTDMNSSAR